MGSLNKWQKAVKETYAGGDFSYLNEWPDPKFPGGDGLFEYLMDEFSHEQGCENDETAARRIDRVMHDIRAVEKPILKAIYLVKD